MIAARHPHVAENKLRKEGQVKSDENNQRCKSRPAFGVPPSGHLRPPEMNATEITHHRSPNHDVMKVGDHEIRIMHMDIDTESGEKQTGQATDGEETDKAQCVEHGRIVGDGPFVKGGRPIEDLDRRRYGNQKTKQRKKDAGMNRLSRNEHVMAPNQKTDHRNGQASERNHVVAEYPFARKASDQLAHNTHGRQDHDVYRGM